MLDPIATSRRVELAYQRYLQTTFNPRDPRFRAAFQRQLRRAEHRLGKGPILQASAPYTLGAPLSELVSDGVLSPDLLSVDQRILPSNRPLYQHQEEAILKVVAGDNVIVATGTGSGKTESFLIPIINSLLHERESDSLHRPGVRALLLYPMNALANDQLKRLRQLLSAFPDITFGRYTGETEESFDTALALHRELTGEDPLPNELISREQITARPPHILITNFAMLEYLLLRPRDSELFDGDFGGQWKYLVLDEIHVYDGSKGTEIGYLLRRLRDRVVQSERGRLTCIGTSATLGAEPDVVGQVVDFARALFDEPFTPWSLVFPHRQRLDDLEATWTSTPEQVAALLLALDSAGADAGSQVAALLDAAKRTGCPMVEAGEDAAVTLGRLLAGESTVVALRRELALHARDIAASDPDAADETSLVRLVELAWRAVDPASNPLLPARYHLFLRALEGAFVCLDSGHPDDDPVFLERHATCPTCERAGRLRRLFEFGACRRCGAGYALGRVGSPESNELEILNQAGTAERQLVHLLLEEVSAAQDEDDSVEEEISQANVDEMLCASCGAFGVAGVVKRCCDSPTPVAVTRVGPSDDGTVRRCAACGSHTNSNIVFRFVSGADASGSVVASALYQDLPEVLPGPGAAVPADESAGGRKLLTFSDSRQDAAFFANFMQRTHDRALQRRVVWAALDRLNSLHPGERPQFEDLVPRVVNLALEHGIFSPSLPVLQRSSVVRKWLLAELVSVDVGQTLEGVGLARLSPAVPEGLAVPQGLLPDGLSAEVALELTLALLGTLRSRNAIRMPEDVSIDDAIFAPRHFTPAVRGHGSDKKVLAWSPAKAYRNARLDLVERVFARHGVIAEARDWLDAVWGWLSAPQSPWQVVLPAFHDKRLGHVHQLAPESFEFLVEGPAASPSRCATCRSVTWWQLGGVCTRNSCGGVVMPCEADADDHYRSLYTSLRPIPARVEEHTAQLANAEAARRQMEFVRGAVNILSCSTTFELGVDVGEIQAVLMRNVPPGPANYVQRAGRAGRRSGSPALVVTMAQRRNHDAHFFSRPEKMIEGQVAAPIVKVDNVAIARRHVHSVALSAFLRHWIAAGGTEPTNVGEFYEPSSTSNRSASDEWVEWLRSKPPALGEALSRMLPHEVASELGIVDWAWVDRLADPPLDGDGGWLFLAQNRARATIAELEAEIGRLSDERKFAAAEQVQRVQAAIRKTRILSDLARKIVLPKYGFPVDTAPLDLSRSQNARAARLDLDRDLSLGIVEYAPGSQVVADKYLWESVGVVIPRGLDLLTYSWKVCRECQSLTSKLSQVAPETCHVCGSDAFAAGGKFVWPQHGFVGEAVGEAGDQRPNRSGGAEMYFASYAHEPEPEMVELNGHPTTVIVSRHGEIQLINSGSKGYFALCRTCGRMEPPPKSRRRKGEPAQWKHMRPGTQNQCQGTQFEAVALGHQFRTDVLEIRLDAQARYEVVFSGLQALLSALPALGIRRGDVSGILRVHDVGQAPGVILLDAVPGGAGYAHHLRDHLPELFAAAWQKVYECSCGIETSCYGCLRTYENQRHHDMLSRRAAMRVLRPYVLGAVEPLG